LFLSKECLGNSGCLLFGCSTLLVVGSDVFCKGEEKQRRKKVRSLLRVYVGRGCSLVMTEGLQQQIRVFHPRVDEKIDTIGLVFAVP
jgi:hypothetical protein